MATALNLSPTQGTRTKIPEAAPPDFSSEVRYTLYGIAFTLFAAVMLGLDVAGVTVHPPSVTTPGQIVGRIVFLAIAYFLIYGNLVYQIARLGYLRRTLGHRPASRDDLEQIYDRDRPPALSILVPSYKEEQSVVLQTLLSAALMDYPVRRVVLLIDDPPNPADTESANVLRAMRELTGEVSAMLSRPRRQFSDALTDFQRRRANGPINSANERHRLARLYQDAAGWLDEVSNSFASRDHTDRLFIHRVLGEPAKAHRARALELESAAFGDAGRSLTREYRRLACLFAADFSSFERKSFANLSHAPNKAMNLNSYIGMIGKKFATVTRHDGVHLEECDAVSADLRIADAEYLITLDADSLLLNDYALRLVHFMEQPENCRVAVAQTPYSAVPGTTNLMERVAGATTDIQHIIHQGFTHFGATYWVGANALLRKRALDEIAQTVIERGYAVTKYIQDRTVIEDTESSVDLAARGWTLYNYPDRLAYSATPPDFGALVIQRRRWANGGLIILPKLLEYLGRQAAPIRERLPESMLRTHYLTSLAGVSLGMVLLLGVPFEGSMRSLWLPLTALPYFLLYGRDLVAIGYRWLDLARIYALNLLLVPVSLGGVFRSLYQMCSGRPTAFGRTPKVTGRTAAPALYVLSGAGIAVWCAASSVFDVQAGRWAHAAFESVNCLFMAYAMYHLVGLRAAWEDVGSLWRREPRPEAGFNSRPLQDSD